MKYYEVYCDGWHSYSNYFSSLEKIKEVLPNDKEFINRIARSRIRDKVGYEVENYQVLGFTLPTIVIEKDKIMFSWSGIRMVKRVTETIPEVKIEGHPYIPSSTITRTIDEFITTDKDLFYCGYITELELDKPKE